jgi:SAM-dependent methyltransferase
LTSYDHHYESGGFGYDQDRERHGAWVRENYVQRFGLRPGQRLLDVGCGDGFWSGLFAEEGLTVAGFDLSAGGIGVAATRYPTGDFRTGDVEAPFPFEGPFDIVFIRNLSHFLRADLPVTGVLTNALRVLEGHGLLLISQFSRRTGVTEGHTTHHPLSRYVAAVEQVAEVHTVHVVDDHILIGAAARNA